MTYTIHTECIACDSCRPQCPTHAIAATGRRYTIEENLCNNCQGYYSYPLCVVVCPTLHPVPLERAFPSRLNKGRSRSRQGFTPTSVDLFSNGKSNPFASSIVIWEACNILAQKTSLPWKTDAEGKLCYERIVQQGKGAIYFRISNYLDHENPPSSLSTEAALNALEKIDIRAACLHLIYAAYATTLDRPWEQEFVINDKQIETYLGLDKRKDLCKHAKLALIKYLAQQPCQLTQEIDWPQRGKLRKIIIKESSIWHLLGIEHHFIEDENGEQHVEGLTFRIKAGVWAEYFLNQQGCREKTAFYQYGILPKFLLKAVMSIWQKREGTARMMLWLLFKTRIGRTQPIAVSTLMKVAYGEEKIQRSHSNRNERKKRIRTFENDLEDLNNYGFKPVFDPDSYPSVIQPLWVKLLELPEDSDAELEFWIDDAGKERRLTDPPPRGKWQMLMKARLLQFEIPPELERPLTDFEEKKHRRTQQKGKRHSELTGEQVKAAREKKGLSQRRLAQILDKSQSWVRDIENGRFKIKSKDQEPLKTILDLNE